MGSRKQMLQFLRKNVRKQVPNWLHPYSPFHIISASFFHPHVTTRLFQPDDRSCEGRLNPSTATHPHRQPEIYTYEQTFDGFQLTLK